MEGVQRLASDAGLGESLGRNGRAYIVKHFSRPQTARDYLQILEGILSNKAVNVPTEG